MDYIDINRFRLTYVVRGMIYNLGIPLRNRHNRKLACILVSNYFRSRDIHLRIRISHDSAITVLNKNENNYKDIADTIINEY